MSQAQASEKNVAYILSWQLIRRTDGRKQQEKGENLAHNSYQLKERSISTKQGQSISIGQREPNLKVTITNLEKRREENFSGSACIGILEVLRVSKEQSSKNY